MTQKSDDNKIREIQWRNNTHLFDKISDIAFPQLEKEKQKNQETKVVGWGKE